MFYAVSWFVVLALLALWSLAAWAFHAVAVWAISNAGVFTGAASGVERLQLPAWLEPWVPPEVMQLLTDLLAKLAPVIDSLIQSAPSLAGGLTVTTWIVWGFGSALLILLGVGLHAVIALLRRRGGRAGGPSHPQVTA